MPKQYYCQNCGKELEVTPKAIPGKGIIVHFVSPHDCPGFLKGSNEEGKPTLLDKIKEMKSVGHTVPDSARRGEKTNLIIGKDLRNEKDLKTTSAPGGILNQMQNMEPE